MKKTISLLCLALCVALISTAQNELQIHHVNIGNGDCTIIAITDDNGSVVTKTIIDGGNSNFTKSLKPYINQQFGGNVNFRYLILSHFHADHYNGLMVIDEQGGIRPDTIIDGGGYAITAGAHNAGLNPQNTKFPPPTPVKKWTTAVSNYGNNRNTNASRPVRMNNPLVRIGDSIILGTIKGVNVTLTCIAADGWNLGPNLQPVDNITGGRSNQNNFSLGWLLRYGKFRYYTAGDIGGRDNEYQQTIPDGNGGTDSITVTCKCGSYTNQETSISLGLNALLQNAQPVGGGANVAGHVCGVKISHHGSYCSSNPVWLNALRAAVYFTSAGGNKRWKLPKMNTIYNMSRTQSVSNNGNPIMGIYNQGFYFTNIYNFNGQGSFTYANKLFLTRANTNYDHGNDIDDTQGNYMLVVPPQNILTKSEFQVWRINCPFDIPNHIPQIKFLARYECHQ